MPKTVAKFSDYKVLATIGTGSFGTCKKIQRNSDGKVYKYKYGIFLAFHLHLSGILIVIYSDIRMEGDKLWWNE